MTKLDVGASTAFNADSGWRPSSRFDAAPGLVDVKASASARLEPNDKLPRDAASLDHTGVPKL